ncbi:MAG: hypothetical protein EFT35_01675 [Methanophagales archaeon ANME-1-THS]|nr:MAG: hypothetical protein EFT35_01675 [Methanophagales archaeon ANME-1-THS]
MRGHKIALRALRALSIAVLLLHLLILVVPAQSADTLYYFYSADCPHCREVTPIIEELETTQSDITVKKFEIGYNETNSELFNTFIQAYNPPKVEIPAVFIGRTALVGSEVTRARLEDELAFCSAHECPDPLELVQGQNGQEPEAMSHASLLTMLIGTAVVEGINPCGFAVLILLLSALLMVKSRRGVLVIGLTFIASVFVTHVVVGMGILKFYLISGITPVMRALVIAIVIPAGIINLLDFWREKSTLAIPAFVKPTLGKLARYATLPAAVFLGILSTIAGLPCTGPIYLAMLDLIADVPSKMALYLVIYNLFYTLPLVALLTLVYKETSAEELDAWRKDRRRYMKLIGGLVMLAIALAMLSGLI